MSRHHFEAVHGLGLHTGLALQPSLTPEGKQNPVVITLFVNELKTFSSQVNGIQFLTSTTIQRKTVVSPRLNLER